MRVLTDRFHIGQGTQIGPITAFPVWTEAKLSISYDTTPVATLQVSELDSPTIESLNIASTHPLNYNPALYSRKFDYDSLFFGN